MAYTAGKTTGKTARESGNPRAVISAKFGGELLYSFNKYYY